MRARFVQCRLRVRAAVASKALSPIHAGTGYLPRGSLIIIYDGVATGDRRVRPVGARERREWYDNCGRAHSTHTLTPRSSHVVTTSAAHALDIRQLISSTHLLNTRILFDRGSSGELWRLCGCQVAFSPILVGRGWVGLLLKASEGLWSGVSQSMRQL